MKIATEYSQTLHYARPVEIGGKQPFQILAIWMLKEPVHYAPNLVAILEHYREFLARGPTVIAGDFNANPKFDAQHKHYLFETITAKFDELGLCSAYHECTGEAHGAETQPTFYFRRHRNRPFHIDYLLCPKPWRSKLGEITVGSYEAFAGLSDHRPITAQFTV